VHSFKAGDDVFGFVDVKRSGGYAEYIIAKADEIGLKPQNIDFAHAAAIPVGALTSWQALFETANLQTGQTILIHGGTGGVGSLAIQLARSRGAYVIATGSKQNEEFVRSLGADAFIDYTARRFEDVVHGVDVVFDTVGGQTQERSLASLRIGGCLVSIVAPLSAELAAKHNVRAAVVYARPDSQTLAEISRLIEDERLYSSIDTLLPLSEVQQAHRLMETGHKRGKIVLQIGEKGVSDG
jgi:NADPH:quinone reductase-like Zn-dependent oxidoreductase